MERTVLSLIAGVAVSVFCVVLVELMGGWIYPPLPIDPGISFEQQMKQADLFPSGYYFVALGGWLIASLIGGCLAGLIAGRAHREHGLLIGIALLMSGVWRLLGDGAPFWFWMLGLGVLIPAAMAGALVAGKIQD